MKKRKELDALVSNGKIGTSKRANTIKKGSGSCSAHELLRHDTESSDMEDFSILQPRRKGRKKHGSRLCITSVCLPLCQFILVTTSFLVSGALIWLHIGLREDIDLLRAHLQKVEAGNRNTPEALHITHNKLKQLDSNVTMLCLEVRKNIADIENLTSEVKLLKDVASSLKESIASAPAIQQLPKDVHSLSERVASFGSKMLALETNIKELKDQQSNMQTTAQNLSGELDMVKLTLLEVSNSTDGQSKSSGNSSAREVKIQNALQKTDDFVHYLQRELMNVIKSVNKINSTCMSHMDIYNELPGRVKTLDDAVAWIVNNTNLQNAHLQALENFLSLNLTLRIEHLESEQNPFLEKPSFDIEDYVNRSLVSAILHTINDRIYQGDIHNIFQDDQNFENNHSLQVLEQTHDVLVLLAALLQQFEQLPKTIILSKNNATEVVSQMLENVINKSLIPRDMKIKAMEHDIKNISSCLEDTKSPKIPITMKDDDDDYTTPLFVPSPVP